MDILVDIKVKCDLPKDFPPFCFKKKEVGTSFPETAKRPWFLAYRGLQNFRFFLSQTHQSIQNHGFFHKPWYSQET